MLGSTMSFHKAAIQKFAAMNAAAIPVMKEESDIDRYQDAESRATPGMQKFIGGKEIFLMNR